MADQPRTTHDCPGGCGLQVPRHQLACKPDWWRLPPDLRNAVNGSYHNRVAGHRPDPHGAAASAHRRALRAALNWYRDHPRRPGGR